MQASSLSGKTRTEMDMQEYYNEFPEITAIREGIDQTLPKCTKRTNQN